MEITHYLIRVSIFGSETLALGECASELNLAGYNLNFSSSSKSRNEVEYDDDIFIVGMSEFSDADNLAHWTNTPSPFLILGIDSLPTNVVMQDVLESRRFS
ncbi:MAG: hypothetical protein MUQ51_09975 [Pseudomonadota bacterium]|nr:hypothetical protein [Pseudomonadota bacterium]